MSNVFDFGCEWGLGEEQGGGVQVVVLIAGGIIQGREGGGSWRRRVRSVEGVENWPWG